MLKRWNSPENRKKRSARARLAALARWEREFADREPRPAEPKHYYRMTVENGISGKVTTVEIKPGTRKNNRRIVINGSLWKICGATKAEGLILKNIFTKDSQ